MTTMVYALTEIALPDGIIGSDDELDAFSARLGGSPSWLINDPHLTTSRFTCKMCSSYLYLLVQFDNPRKPETDRVIYVFCCNSRKCSQTSRGWEVVIQERAFDPKRNTKMTPLWDSLMNDDGGMSESLEKISLSDNLTLPYFPAYHLHITEELLPTEKDSTKTGFNFKGEDSFKEFDTEIYEKTIRPSGFDKAIDTFQRRVSHYPRQCVRISKEPLLFNASDSITKHEKCLDCGNVILFEFQLMPAILSLLPVERHEYITHLKVISSHPISCKWHGMGNRSYFTPALLVQTTNFHPGRTRI